MVNSILLCSQSNALSYSYFRSEIHWFFHVYDLCHLVSFCRSLFCNRCEDFCIMRGDECKCICCLNLSLFPETVFDYFQTGKKSSQVKICVFSFALELLQTKTKHQCFLCSVHSQQIRTFVVISVRQQHRKVICHPIDSVKAHHYFVNLFYIVSALAILSV